MTKKKAKIPNDYVYEGRYLIELLHGFYHDNDGERLIALSSLNSETPGLFDDFSPILEDEDDDDPDDPDSLEISQIEEGGKIRILTDVLNHSDWRTLWDFAQYTDIEIRHVKNLDMYLFVHLGRKHAFNITGPMRFDEKFIDYDTDVIGFETSTDYKVCQRFFENIWEEAEPITSEKIEHFNELWSNSRVDFDKELLQHTYFLFPEGKKDDYDLMKEREERVGRRTAFSGEIMHGEDGPFSFAYIVGIKIPRDAEQIVICHVDEKSKRIKYDQTFRVFGINPIREIDDTLDFYYPERGFSIVQGWDKESSVVDTYPRPKKYYSKNIYMAMQVFDFNFDKYTKKIENTLSQKFHNDAAFRNALKETCFVKWSEVIP